MNCIGITSVVIPDSVTTIGTNTFFYCRSLSSIILPDSVTFIGGSCFNSCFSLTSVVIPKYVSGIAPYSFEDCSSLCSVFISCPISYIKTCAFLNCSSLTSVYYNSENPIEDDADAFEGCPDTAILYVPQVAVEKCKGFMPWKKFKNIQAYEFADKEEIIDDLNVCAQYDIFNLNGIREPGKSECLSKGFYIIRNGNITKKIAVK